MKLSRVFPYFAGLTLAVSTCTAVFVKAQTVISDETLKTTTLVVNKQEAIATCKGEGCHAVVPMFAPIQVTCPAAIGQTCTFHIFLDAKTSVLAFSDFSPERSGKGFYRFLVDDAAPTIGPTDQNGDYLFLQDVLTYSPPDGPSRESYPASLVAVVTNSTSNSHTITVSVGCRTPNNFYKGCAAKTHQSTMRVDVFEP